MTLPTSRNTTYAADVQIKSADINDCMDKIADNYFDDSYRVPAAYGVVTTGSASKQYADGSVQFASVSDVVELSISIKPSTNLYKVRARVLDENATSTITLALYEVDTGGLTSIDTDSSASDGSVQTLEVEGDIDTDAPDTNLGTTYIARLTIAGSVGGGSYAYAFEVETQTVT